ncbi:MAG TPA: isoprenylcysteine carboxylmethyltransferase family protein [Xanthobacteraceae bacterium]|nr:isoprenylcysteine carboxylmethyltransferase family protein [Xanthobacteraceae bacterium]
MRTTTLAPAGVDIGAVQTIRKLFLLLSVATLGTLFVFGAPRWSSRTQEAIEWIGLGLIFVCIVGRTWCALYIGGRKNCELVRIGPYSICRNPLYVFSVIGAVGAGAQFGAFSVAILAGLIAGVIHVLVVRQEERLMLSEHGDIYRRYVAEVPRFLPRFSLWTDVEVLEVRPRTVVTTFVDACFFLAAVPIAESFEYFQQLGYLHVFLRLP